MVADLDKIAANRSFWAGQVDYVDEWTLMPTPYPIVTILVAYLLFVLKLGPQFMKNREPFKLNNILLFYNAFQVAFSCYLCSIGISAILEKGLVESSCFMNEPETRNRIVTGHYWYFVAKLTELLDTVFFVLRKKWNQLSFLHVYHHTIMYFAAWTALKYEPTFSLVFLGTLNSFVHIIMYGYYGLAAFPGLEKYLWWKKYITKMQLIQFAVIMVQITWNSIVSECPLSYFLLTLCWAHGFLFIYLFTDFYVKSYLQKRRESNAKMNLQNHKVEELKSKHVSEIDEANGKKSVDKGR
ncbi:elongation of very long chain fatty acids protein 4-like [Pectinophora gossypiella]|uniref:elongation of very long chain fatty acids protein 4-like n=1 Tax=Pectinophora gossypiella TaxID=13191 RepID=UPI00214F1C54|nr:elongation of very long chain fatty acids protein 4-like [Pectinophora gossypiella]